MKRLITCLLPNIVRLIKSTQNMLDRTCSTDGENETLIQNFGHENSKGRCNRPRRRGEEHIKMSI
jgi:hypothetical protein